jgi:hypothetical protein
MIMVKLDSMSSWKGKIPISVNLINQSRRTTQISFSKSQNQMWNILKDDQAAISDSCRDYHYHSVQREKTDSHAENNSIRSYYLDLQDMKTVQNRRQSSFNIFHIWFWLLLKEICVVLLDWLIRLTLIGILPFQELIESSFSMRISLFPLHWVIMVISTAVRNRSLQ